MTKTTKIVISLSFLALLVGAVAVAYMWKSNATKQTSSTQSPQASTAQTKDQTTPNSSDTTAPTTAATNDGKATSPSSYVAPTNSEAVTFVASQPSADKVNVVTKLIGYSDGTCRLHVTNAGKTQDIEASVLFQREFATCAGFTLSTAQLGVGTWDINLSVISGGKTVEKSSKLEVK